MKIEVTLKSGHIFRGEFAGKRELLFWIEIAENECDKQTLSELFTSNLPGVSSMDIKNGVLEITLRNSEIEKVVVL